MNRRWLLFLALLCTVSVMALPPILQRRMMKAPTVATVSTPAPPATTYTDSLEYWQFGAPGDAQVDVSEYWQFGAVENGLYQP